MLTSPHLLPPRFGPTIAVRRPRVQQAAGYDVILQCQMEAFPGPKINWFQLGNEQVDALRTCP